MKFSVIASVVALFAQCNAKLNLIHVDSTSTPFLVSDIYAAHKFATGEDLVVDSPGGGQQLAVTNPSAVTQIKLKSELSPACSSKLCSMFQYALTCKALGLGLNKICASYFLGANFGCNIFPAPSDFFNAPLICIQQFGKLALLLNSTDIIGSMQTYLGKTFQTNTCGRRCYQNYQATSNDFYSSCFAPMQNKTIQSTYKVAGKIANFQYFRNQACAVNNNNTNCYVQFTNMPTSKVDIFQPTCNYAIPPAVFNKPIAVYGPYVQVNNQALAGICTQFGSFGCCAANDVTLYQSSQTNTSNLAIFPPCLLSYFENNCPQVNLQNYCKNGSMASITTAVGSVLIARAEVGQKLLFPNMYNKTSIAQLQAAISTALGYMGALEAPWHMIPTYPFEVQIISYVYYNKSGDAVTPVDPVTGNATGVPAFPPGNDYTLAQSGRFTYQLVFQNVVSQEQATGFINPAMTNADTFAAIVSFAYTFGTVPVQAELVSPAVYQAAQPLELPPNSAYSVAKQTGMLSLLSMSVVAVMFVMW